jgi:predicted O-methyltransferase YrrM
MDFEQYLADMPLLHSWDGGATWNNGGFSPEHLRPLHAFLKERFAQPMEILETGAGNSTICFLFLSPRRLVSIAPEPDLFDRIRSFCQSHDISTLRLESYVEGSEWALPRLAAGLPNGEPCFDFVLLDGSHNWPMVFLDFFYCNYMLKRGGYVMVDDVNLHSVKELARMLSEQRDFRIALDLGKALLFERTTDKRVLPEWLSLPYIWRKTADYSQWKNPFEL